MCGNIVDVLRGSLACALKTMPASWQAGAALLVLNQLRPEQNLAQVEPKEKPPESVTASL